MSTLSHGLIKDSTSPIDTGNWRFRKLARKRPNFKINLIIFTLLMFALASVSMAQTVVYDAIPSSLPPNIASEGFQATQTAEFGDYVHLAGTNRVLKTVTVTMSDWAVQASPGNVAFCSANPASCPSGGFKHPITLNVYSAGPVVGGLRTKGTLLGTVTQTFTIPWRPADDLANCPADSAWFSGGTCYHGLAFNISFDFSNVFVNLPNDVILGVAYSTQTWGAAPLGVDGPYNSLNVGAQGTATTGTDDNVDRVFINSQTAGNYTDGGAGGVGIFREDTAWTPFGTPNFRVTTVPPPSPVVINASLGNPQANPNAWVFYNDENDTIDNVGLGSMVNGPATPPLGTGSAQISVTGTQRRNLATYQFSGTPLAAISTLKFSTYNPSAGNGGSANRSGYITFNVDFNGSDTFQRRLNFVPSQNGSVTQNNWKEWDAINGGNAQWSYSGNNWPAGVGGGGELGTTLKTWNQILSQYPGVRIRVSDAFFGIRVGEPYNDGYTENIDAIKFGTPTSLKYFNFDPLPAITYVDDSWASVTPGSDPDGAGPATNFGYDSFATIQGGIDGVAVGGTVNVAAGNYSEDVLINKNNLVVSGAGASGTQVIGPIGGAGSTFSIAANNVELRGFKITRAGNNTTDWNNASLNTAGVSVQGQSISGMNVHDNLITGMRTGIDVNDSSGHSIHNNVITDNRTGLIFGNKTDNISFFQNEVTNNWTIGLLFLDRSGAGVPPQSSLGSQFFNNNFSGNWYGQIADRQSGGTLPTPGTTNLKDFSGNWYGTSTPVVTTANTTEPGYAGQIPVEFGGSSTAPGGQPDIAGPASANFDYTPYLAFGGDISPAVYGFQGNFSALNVSAGSAQVGATSKIQEAINLISTGGTLSIPSGTYAGNVDVNKAITVKGIFTVTGTFTVSSPGATLSPGNSPGIINTGNLSLTSGSNLNIEINGNAAGALYDQVNVTGTVNLGGANLVASLGYSPTAGHTYTIVNNDGGDPVTGTFAGLPEGTVFFLGANSFKISYVGGTGNDVVITAVSLCNAVSIPTNITTQTSTTVVAPISVDNTTGNGLKSTDFTVTYNPAVVTFNSISLGTVTAGSTMNVNSSTPGTLIVSVFQGTPFTGAGTLANITFNAVGAPGTSSAVTFTAFKFNEGTPCISTSNGLISILSGSVKGTVSYRDMPAKHVPNTTLSAVGSVNVSTLTGLDGKYTLSGMGAGSYTVTPSKVGDITPADSISSLDAADVATYVVGLGTPLTANQLIVADVSGDGTVSSFDAALIATYAVHLPDHGQAGNWKFLPVSHTYPNVNSDITGQDYVAYLMGDVTGNWANPLATRPIGDSPLVIAAPSLTAASGTKLTIPVSVGDTNGLGIRAYQFDLIYDASVLEPAANPSDTSGTVSDGGFVMVNSTEPGVLRVVTYGTQPLAGSGELLKLNFNVIGAVDTSTDLKWDNFLLNEGGINFRADSGKVQIVASNENSAINGRVLTPYGTPIARVMVTVTDSQGNTAAATSSSFGYYQIAGLRVGESYTVRVTSRQYRFAVQNVALGNSAVNLDLIAQE